MGEIGAIIAASSAASAIGTASQTYSQSQAIKTQGNYAKNQLEFNSQVADLQGKDAVVRGDKAAIEKKKQTKQIIGSQRAALAAQGLEVNADTALDIQGDTAALGAEDVNTIKNNAWREAWGYKVQALNYGTEAKLEDLSSKNRSQQTILTGGLQFARDLSGGAYEYKKYQDSKVKK